HEFGRIWHVQHKNATASPLPNLASDKPLQLVEALQSPNGWARATAQRLLVEAQTQPENVLSTLVITAVSAKPETRIQALWTLQQLGALNETILTVAMGDDESTVRRAGLQIAAQRAPLSLALLRQTRAALNDNAARIRCDALLALARCPADKETAAAIAALYPQLEDNWSRSAALGVSASNPLLFLAAAFKTPDATNWVKQLGIQIAGKQDGKLASKAIELTLKADSTLAQPFLTELSRVLKPEVIPPFTPALQHALETLVNSTNIDVAVATLPLVTRWDKSGTTKTSGLQEYVFRTMNDASQSDPKRAQAVTILLSVAPTNEVVIASVIKLVAPGTSIALQKQTIQALGTVSNGAPALITIYVKAQPELRPEIFAQFIKRTDWSLQFVEALEQGIIDHALLDPNSVYRLRKHADAVVAKRANAFLDHARGPQAQQKDALIARFAPDIAKPGDALQGRSAFQKNCAVCHTLNGEGANIGPNLTGIGAHGREELLVHVLDPNRVVEPNFIVVSVETNDGEELEGIVARENEKSIVLRNATSEHEIARADIKQNRNTGRSLMPEGFEALGAETLRNILAYMCDPKTLAAKK
ncbi:MAG: putative rane-bound dehydrogenase, partial [Verrucomicrobiales bacterium]|nr:putative rane-bound dehydrogenase [Verrucomicrobiales bacterium]